MPAVRKLSREEVVAETYTKTYSTEPKKRGRPVGSKNKVNAQPTSNKGFEPEKLYTYRAKDGCEMQSAVKSSKTMSISCKHGKTMELVK